MKTTEELLYQIRGLARIAVAFSFFYQGLVPKWLTHDPAEQAMLMAHGVWTAYPGWISHISGLFEMALACWLVTAFTDKKPLWVTGGVLVFFLLDTMIFSPAYLGTTFNAVTTNITLLALVLIDQHILKFQADEINQRRIGQYFRFTRDRMLYEFVKRLELKDLPHLMHTLTQSRIKRRRKVRQKLKESLQPAESPLKDRSQIDRRSSNDRRRIFPLPQSKRTTTPPPDDTGNSAP